MGRWVRSSNGATDPTATDCNFLPEKASLALPMLVWSSRSVQFRSDQIIPETLKIARIIYPSWQLFYHRDPQPSRRQSCRTISGLRLNTNNQSICSDSWLVSLLFRVSSLLQKRNRPREANGDSSLPTGLSFGTLLSLLWFNHSFSKNSCTILTCHRMFGRTKRCIVY